MGAPLDGLVVAFFAGWLGALAPASDAIDGITFIGFVGFFVWMAAIGVSLLLGQRAAASKTPRPRRHNGVGRG